MAESRDAPWPEELLQEVRLAVYRGFVDDGAAPAPASLCRRFGLAPDELDAVVRFLAEERSALVLMPGSSYLWMAEPFSAVPTHFEIHSGGRRWFGNCVWDALAAVALLGGDGVVETPSPVDAEPLRFVVEGGELRPVDAVVHFAVRARDWWRSIGFT